MPSNASSIRPASAYGRLNVVLAALLLAILAAAALLPLRWPLVHDAPLMQYIAFLMRHGMAPYKNIVELEMPGTYLFHWGLAVLFGDGPMPLKICDALASIAAAAAMVYLASAGERVAALFAAACFAVYHYVRGMLEIAQRDYFASIMLLCGLAALALAIRLGRPRWALAFGFLACFAASIKPTLLLIPALQLALACWTMRAQRRDWTRCLAWALAGFALCASALLAMLLGFHAARAFFAAATTLIPFYARLQNAPLLYLAETLLPAPPAVSLCALIGAAALAAWTWKRRDWATQAIILGALAGLVSYFVQRKGFGYHKYPYLLFGMLWLSLEFVRALRATPAKRTLASAVLLLFALALPVELWRHRRIEYFNQPFVDNLQSDLQALGPARLDHSVQCLDMTAGCINVLDRMRLVQSTGYINDFHVLADSSAPVIVDLKQDFEAKLEANPPLAIIYSDQVWPGDSESFAPLANNPALAAFLAKDYRLAIQRDAMPRVSIRVRPPWGYRLYVRNDAAPR